MSQFDLIDVPSSNESITVGNVKGGTVVCKQIDDTPEIRHKIELDFLPAMNQEYSVLLVSFHLQRHMGNFLIQVYGPCIREFRE